jgi:hypothetical protein
MLFLRIWCDRVARQTLRTVARATLLQKRAGQPKLMPSRALLP